ncbi:MAG: tyrosine--tRNA ligase [Candidatus Woesearchaeota archaeon]
MNVEDRFNLIKQVGEEIITEEELKKILEEKKHPIAYDGFEPSGIMHIAQGLMRVININKMIKSGCYFKMLIADWHAWANNKFNGDLEKIQKAGQLMIETWKACGLKTDNVEFIWANDLVKNPEYWKKVMRIATNSTLKRIIRCGQIMGRKEKEMLSAAQIFYPCMQAADIFELDVDICQLGLDQRKVNILARELAPKLGYKKPVAVHHHMLLGLQTKKVEAKEKIEQVIELKMSKSKPETAIFMTDDEKTVYEKILKAYCPEKEIENNPIIEYCKYIIFEVYSEIKIERPEKFGGNIELNYNELLNVYSTGQLHPLDLKKAVAYYINELLKPVRNYFEKNKKAKELLEEVSSYYKAI